MIAAMMIARYLAGMIIGYLLGSIPWGLILAKRMTGVDVREVGSGKIGATNVLRSAGRKVAILSGLLDFAKGAAAVLFAGLIIGKSYMIVGRLVLAHTGSGISRFSGRRRPQLVDLSQIPRWQRCRRFLRRLNGFSMVGRFIRRRGSRYRRGFDTILSLGSLAGVVGTYAILIPLTIVNHWPIEYLLYAFGGTAMIIYTHRGNIVRLFNGIERKLGERADKIRRHPNRQNKKV